MGFEGTEGNTELFLCARKEVRLQLHIISLGTLTTYRYSILPAISLDGILDCNIVEGSFNTRKFKDFIEGLLDHMQPYPAPNSVIVLDNCRIHKDPEIIEMVESRYVSVQMFSSITSDASVEA